MVPVGFSSYELRYAIPASSTLQLPEVRTSNRNNTEGQMHMEPHCKEGRFKEKRWVSELPPYYAFAPESFEKLSSQGVAQ